jgi:hypothetical protein
MGIRGLKSSEVRSIGTKKLYVCGPLPRAGRLAIVIVQCLRDGGCKAE